MADLSASSPRIPTAQSFSARRDQPSWSATLPSLHLLENLFSENSVKLGENASALGRVRRLIHSEKLSFAAACRQIDLTEKTGLQEVLGKGELEKLIELSGEPSPQMFFAGLLDWARGLKASSNDKYALAIFQTLEGAEVPQHIRQAARQEFQSMAGQGSSGRRFEYLAYRLFEDATNYRMIIPMFAGTVAYGAVRAGALSRVVAAGRSLGTLRPILPAIAGFAAEVPSFALLSRFLHRRAGLPVRESVAEDLLSAGLTLGLLKSFGFAGQKTVQAVHGVGPLGAAMRLQSWMGWTQPLAVQSSQFFGLLTAHRAEVMAGLCPQTDRATTITDTLAGLVSLGVGATLGHRALGKSFSVFQRELEVQIRAKTRPPDFLSPYSEALAFARKNFAPGLKATSKPDPRLIDLVFAKSQGSGNGGEQVRSFQQHDIPTLERLAEQGAKTAYWELNRRADQDPEAARAMGRALRKYLAARRASGLDDGQRPEGSLMTLRDILELHRKSLKGPDRDPRSTKTLLGELLTAMKANQPVTTLTYILFHRAVHQLDVKLFLKLLHVPYPAVRYNLYLQTTVKHGKGKEILTILYHLYEKDLLMGDLLSEDRHRNFVAKSILDLMADSGVAGLKGLQRVYQPRRLLAED